jgi:hypothetical protein
MYSFKTGVKTVKTYSPRNFRSTCGKLNPKDINANRQWLSYWTNKGAKVFDIGREKGNPVRSPFYGVEQRSIYTNWRYNNVIQLEGY